MRTANVQPGHGVPLAHPDLVIVDRCCIGQGPDHVATRVAYPSGDVGAPERLVTRRGIMCRHQVTPYTRKAGLRFSASEEAQDRPIALPLHPSTSQAGQHQAVAAFGESAWY
jgi:hypothetical protein